jgi:hypothetical protein
LIQAQIAGTINEIVDEGEEVFVLPLLAGWYDLLGSDGRKGRRWLLCDLGPLHGLVAW